jgi:N-ethylmaleimide reductase
MNQLLETITVGKYTLPNRFVMAPMTRSRAQYDGTPSHLAATYYGQRATLGLIVTEGTQPSDDGQGYTLTPGIYTEAHVAGWKAITSAVRDQGGHIFIQLMHTGRISHPDNTPHHRQGVAPSAIAPNAEIPTQKGMQAIPAPRALSVDEIHQTIADFRTAARRAIDAGADGVELHAANSYLIQQFIAPSANIRTDEYGGSLENRSRFAIEVSTAVANEIGAERTGIRISPGTVGAGIDEGSEGPDLYRHLVTQLDGLGLAYLHILDNGNEALLNDLRQRWNRTLILNRPGRSRDQIGRDVASGLADMEAYGQMVLANPDFIARLQADAPMNLADRSTFYGGSDQGYTDYPTLSDQPKTTR